MNVIAIFDVGKTNKKLFLFDEQYRIVWEQTEQFPETTDDDGDPCEDLTQLTAWLHASMRNVLALPEFRVQAVNFSAYGASFVYVGNDGQPVGHLYNYLKPLPDAVRKRFYAPYDSVGQISVRTASPALDSLNSGLMLYRIKYDKPALFGQIRYALHLPQYLSYCLTHEPVSDVTSVGCHTLLWDFPAQQYHGWVAQEGLVTLLAPVHPADQPIMARVGDTESVVPIGVGLHDSSAALIPYLASLAEPFVLISTGTWCISLNPFNTDPLTAEELQYDCLCYLTYRGEAVKASRLFAGHDHEQQVHRLSTHFSVPVDTYKRVRYDARLVAQLALPTASDTVPPTPMQPAQLLQPSRFGHRSLSRYKTYEEAYHQLMLDIVEQQVVSTALVLPDEHAVSQLYVDGGFSHNPIYMTLLARAFPTLSVWAASVAQATALGAALAIHDHWNPRPMPQNLVSLTRYTT